jgi:hypothetical protein
VKLYAWFPQGGRLEVVVREGETAESELDAIRNWQIGDAPSRWIMLVDGSYANTQQIVRLELADE